MLSDDERARFAAEGFLLLPSLLTAAEKANACAWAREVQAWPETAGKWMQYFEVPAGGSRQLCRTENYLGFHDGLPVRAAGAFTAMNDPAPLIQV